MSSQFNIYLRVPDYLAEWITHTFGNPVQMVKDSPEMRVLNELLVKLPKNTIPDLGQNANIIIPIPYFKGKDPSIYNYLHQKSKKALEESFRTLLIKNLMTEVGSIENLNVKISTLIYAWMEKHGIDEKHSYTISQIYYRTRKKYFEENDIKV